MYWFMWICLGRLTIQQQFKRKKQKPLTQPKMKEKKNSAFLLEYDKVCDLFLISLS